MKLSYEDKVQIYELRKQGQNFNQLSNQFGVNVSGLKYMMKLIDPYGIEFVKKGITRSMSRKGTPADNACIEWFHSVLRSVSLDFGLPNQGILSNWLAQYRKKLNR